MNETIDTHALVGMVMKSFSTMPIHKENYSELLSGIATFPYLIDPTGVCKVECKKKGESYSYWIAPISSFVSIAKRLVFVDRDRVDVVIRYSVGATIKEIPVSREITLSKVGIKSLLGYGISFNESHCDSLLTYLLQSERHAPVEYVHSRLGWFEMNGTKFFRSYKSLCKNGALPYTSHYVGSLDLKPRGSLQKWIDMVEHDVLSRTPLTFCLLCGFATPVLSRLYQKFDLGSLVFCLSNDSSRGKTTAAMLATSVFSNPVLGKGMMQNFNATQNALMALLEENSGMTVSLDEGGTLARRSDLIPLFYLICSGKGKSRLTKDAVMRVPSNWNNIVLTTAEFPQVDDESPNGIRTRCFCLTDTMTKNADHADRIKAVITENYGHAGNLFVRWLLNTETDLEADYQRCQQILHNALKAGGLQEGPFTSRVFSRFAIILQIANYVSQCFSFNIRVKHLIKYILRIERNVTKQTDSTQRALDNILAEVGGSSARYVSETKLNPDNAVGKVKQDGDFKLIIIIRPEFNRICKKFGLQAKSVLKEFKKRKWLDCESDRLSKRVRLQSGFPEQVCYVLKIKDPKDIQIDNMEF